jgi:hypothetical protein
VIFKERLYLHAALPTTGYPPAGKHVVLGAAEQEVYLTAYPGASNHGVVVLFDQRIPLFLVTAAHSQAERKEARERAVYELDSLLRSSVSRGFIEATPLGSFLRLFSSLHR